MRPFLFAIVILSANFNGFAQDTIISMQVRLGGSEYEYPCVLIDDELNQVYYTFSSGSSSNGTITSDWMGGLDMQIHKLNTSGEIIWEKNIGGSQDDYVSDAILDADGNIVLLATTYSDDYDVESNFGGCDILVMRIDSSGEIIDQKSFGDSDYEHASKLIKVSSGGFLIAGNVEHQNSWSLLDWSIIKCNDTFDEEWTVDLLGELNNGCSDIIECEDGSFFAIGNSSSSSLDFPKALDSLYGDLDGVITKISESGAILWQKKYGSSSNDYLTSIIYDENIKSYYVAGGIGWGNLRVSYDSSQVFTPSHFGVFDMLILKLDTAGFVDTVFTFGGSQAEIFQRIIKSDDGGLYAGGFTISEDGDIANRNHGYTDNLILKLDLNLNVIYSDLIGSGDCEDFHHFVLKEDGSLLVCSSAIIQGGDVAVNQDWSTTENPDVWIYQIGKSNIVNIVKELEIQFTVFPNPTSDVVHVNVPFSLMGAKYNVYNASGQWIQSSVFTSTDSLIDLSNLSSGTYTVSVPQWGWSKSILKEK